MGFGPGPILFPRVGPAGGADCDTESGVAAFSCHYVTAAYCRSSRKLEKINCPGLSSENMQKLELKPSSYLGGGRRTRIFVSFLIAGSFICNRVESVSALTEEAATLLVVPLPNVLARVVNVTVLQ